MFTIIRSYKQNSNMNFRNICISEIYIPVYAYTHTHTYTEWGKYRFIVVIP